MPSDEIHSWYNSTRNIGRDSRSPFSMQRPQGQWELDFSSYLQWLMISSHQFNSCSTNLLPLPRWVFSIDQTYFSSWVQHRYGFPAIDVSRHIVTGTGELFTWAVLIVADGGPIAQQLLVSLDMVSLCLGNSILNGLCLLITCKCHLGSTSEIVSLIWHTGCLWIACTWASSNF